MEIGLDSFALHPLDLGPVAQLNWVKEHGFGGIQFGDVEHLSGGDSGRLRDIRATADGMSLYTHVSAGFCNPLAAGQPEAYLLESLTRRVHRAAECGWHELHGVLGGPDERTGRPVPWQEQLAVSAHLLKSMAPALRDHGSRINLETHGDVTTFELVRMVEDVGPDIQGICLDTANVVLHGEHPVQAAIRAAPYTHLTHCKDAILYFIPTGLRRQTLPPGSGMIDWPAVVRALAARQPDLRLSIEDHKWLFDAPVFEPGWQALHPDTPRDELLSLIGLAWQCQERIARGELRDPEACEKIPYGDELEQRLLFARDHLRATLSVTGAGLRPCS